MVCRYCVHAFWGSINLSHRKLFSARSCFRWPSIHLRSWSWVCLGGSERICVCPQARPGMLLSSRLDRVLSQACILGSLISHVATPLASSSSLNISCQVRQPRYESLCSESDQATIPLLSLIPSPGSRSCRSAALVG